MPGGGIQPATRRRPRALRLHRSALRQVEMPGLMLDGSKDAGPAPTPAVWLRTSRQPGAPADLAAAWISAVWTSAAWRRCSLIALPACRGPVAARTGKPADASSTVCAQVPGLSILPAFPLSPAGAASRPAFLLLAAEAPAHCRGDGPGLAQARPCLANLKPAPALAKPQCRLGPRPLPQPGVNRGPNRRQPVAGTLSDRFRLPCRQRRPSHVQPLGGVPDRALRACQAQLPDLPDRCRGACQATLWSLPRRFLGSCRTGPQPLWKGATQP